MFTTFIIWHFIGCIIEFLIVRYWNKNAPIRDQLPPVVILCSWFGIFVTVIVVCIIKYEDAIISGTRTTAIKTHNTIMKIGAWINKICNYK